MRFSKYISKAVTQVMALFQKQRSCLSNKATTICGQAAENLRQVPIRHDREDKFAEIKVRFVPPTMCRLTPDDGTISVMDNMVRMSEIKTLKEYGTRMLSGKLKKRGVS